MEPHVADLIDALPEETKRSKSASPQVSLQGLLGKLGQRSVPVGRLNRARIFGTLQAKIAAAYFAYWLRSAYKGIDEKQQRLNETHLKAALELLAGMSYLRGAVMKMGQMIANYPHVAPEEFAQVFGVLHFEAPPMHFSLLREFVRNELGADPQELFDDFETKAFAAASLGQVHRARLKGSGERVAIKIQYPSIARTIRDDLGNLRALLLPMRLSGNWDNLKLQFEDVCRMLERETDYQQEADDLRRARSAFEDNTGILVPKVYEDYSTERVLTMEYVDGVHLGKFLESDPPVQARDRFGERIVRATARLWYGENLLYADPHPRNYFFMPDGRLGLVDFGCCHHFSREDLDYRMQMEEALTGSPDTLREALAVAVDAKPDQEIGEDLMRRLEECCHWLWEPVRHEGPFDFSSKEYFQRGTQLFGEVLRNRSMRSLPVNIWLDRNFFGIRALLYRLGARVNYGAIIRQESAIGTSTP